MGAIDHWLGRARAVVGAALQMLRPPPELTVSEWSDQHRYLSAESSAAPGRWRTDAAVWTREIMDAFTEPEVEEVVVMASGQVAKTETVLNLIGYHITQDPAPMLYVQATVDMGEAFSKDRLRPMLRDSPIFADIFPDISASRTSLGEGRARDSGDTIMHKVFPGGHITISGANSAASLASRPVRVVIMDEVDRYPPSAGNEGDPVKLAKRRANNFWNRKFVQVSTPKKKGTSRIEKSYSHSDQRRFFVPCAKCGEWEPWDKWAMVEWDKDEHGVHLPHTAGIVCGACKYRHTEAERQAQVKRGTFRATAKFTKVVGFHFNELISPWRSLEEIVTEFLGSKDDQAQLQTFVNTVLGETFEEAGGEELDQVVLANRREPHQRPPGDVLLITAGVDVQDDRLAVEVVGWGVGNESWGITYRQLVGNPGGPDLWERLDDFLLNEFTLDDNRKLPIAGCLIDSGGHYTTEVYKFCKARFGRRIIASKGRAQAGVPIANKLVRSKKDNQVRLMIVGTDAAKERLLMSWLKLTKTGPGYCHFPEHYDDTYFAELTAERRVTKYHRGHPYHAWEQHRPRNEALDCRILAIAAMEMLAPNYEQLQRRISGEVLSQPPKPSNNPPADGWMQQPRSDWMDGGTDRPF